jgi:hypothetical protein
MSRERLTRNKCGDNKKGNISGAHMHIESRPFISHTTITCLFFSFQPSHMPLGAYLVHMACGRVETKKYELSLDER